MKSGGGSGAPPQMPSPQGQSVPYGQASPAQPSYVNFLPNDGTMMAEGLSPAMMKAIQAQQGGNAPPPLLGGGGLPPGGMQALASQLLPKMNPMEGDDNNSMMLKDAYNAGPSLGGYLNTRDQLSKYMAGRTRTRDNSIFRGGR